MVVIFVIFGIVSSLIYQGSVTTADIGKDCSQPPYNAPVLAEQRDCFIYNFCFEYAGKSGVVQCRPEGGFQNCSKPFLITGITEDCAPKTCSDSRSCPASQVNACCEPEIPPQVPLPVIVVFDHIHDECSHGEEVAVIQNSDIIEKECVIAGLRRATPYQQGGDCVGTVREVNYYDSNVCEGTSFFTTEYEMQQCSEYFAGGYFFDGKGKAYCQVDDWKGKYGEAMSFGAWIQLKYYEDSSESPCEKPEGHLKNAFYRPGKNISTRYPYCFYQFDVPESFDSSENAFVDYSYVESGGNLETIQLEKGVCFPENFLCDAYPESTNWVQFVGFENELLGNSIKTSFSLSLVIILVIVIFIS